VLDADADERKTRHELRAWHAWHTAVLGRVKKMPTLASLTAVKKEKRKGVDESALKAHLKAYQKRREERR
jgi:hypothetical protein